MAKKAPTSEPGAFVDIAGYVYQNAGKATAKLQVGNVNEELKPDNAELIKTMKRVRVSMRVEEDQSVLNGQVYQKDVTMDQQVLDEAPSGKAPKGSTYAAPNAAPTEEGSSGPSPLQVLKNFVDNIASDNRLQWIALIGIGMLAVTALAVAVLR
jgi:hypothetical protein